MSSKTLPVEFTLIEAKAMKEAIGQMTEANLRDFDEWHSQTGGTRQEWNALLRAENKLSELIGKHENIIADQNKRKLYPHQITMLNFVSNNGEVKINPKLGKIPR